MKVHLLVGITLLVFAGPILGKTEQKKTLDFYRKWYATLPDAPRFPPATVLSKTSIIDPSFDAYIRAQQPNLLSYWLMRFHVIKRPWDLLTLAGPLERLTERNLQTRKPSRELTLDLKERDRVILFGNIHGAVHSFLRDLDELKARGLITEDLKLASDTYLIFIGDLLNYSPHTFELLDLVCTLLEQNPGCLFYLRNEQEKDSTWSNLLAMRDQLKQRRQLWGGSDEQLPLKRELDAFFNTLADTIYLNRGEGSKKIMIGGARRPTIGAEESRSYDAMILGEMWEETVWESTGLEFFGFRYGTAIWSLRSCPNQFYQDVINFYYDSFVILHNDVPARQMTLEFLNRDIRSADPAFKSQLFALSFGIPVKKGDPLLGLPRLEIGSTMVLTGAISAVGQGMKDGLEAVLMRANRSGGVRGHLIHPVIVDDGYVPRLASRNVDFLKKNWGISILFGPQGTPTLNAYAKRVRDGEFDLFFPLTGGYEFRTPEALHMINCRTSYKQEVTNLMSLLCENYRIVRFAFLYQDDAFGRQLLHKAVEILRARGINSWVEIAVRQNKVMSQKRIRELVSTGVEAIGIFFSSPVAAENFLNSLGAAFVFKKHVFASSFLNSKLLPAYLEAHGIGLILSCAFPLPHKGYDIPIMQECVEDLERYHRPITSESVEGYIAASIFIEAVRHVKGSITGEKIMHWLESLRGYNFKGISLTFHPETRSFELPGWLRTENGKWHRASKG
ncbi:MAG: ABC transporter substrate-binding protein [Candidatus Dependentiae bacterium]|nr:ABC transporter substrate-binding protein [Candidatus Dependentiae bacterium]